MVSLFGKRRDSAQPTPSGVRDLVRGFSIEVMPRTAAKIEDFQGLLPQDTRVYIAHIEGTPIEDMVATAQRLGQAGFEVMPHFPARIIRDRAMLQDWVKRYSEEAGVTSALLLGGSPKTPVGEFDSSMQMLETGVFDTHGFTRLHVAGHPEGNRDIDADGSTKLVDDALRWKQDYSERTDAEMAIVTQFVFDAAPVLNWISRLREAGVTLPVHVGVSGPAKLQTLIRFAIACGVGPSLKVLEKRALDLSKLLVPYEPTDVLSALADARQIGKIAQIHFFPLGGIKTCAEWAKRNGGAPLQAVV
ncbi:methylenetetrahydrofolate reductase [Pseudooceanicola sediminis]|uniref:Methylenetetrahydrofolate reductase n=1 Tax=Pseudooceanicola sediminis TaxID=2211117 RepID=A0A399J1X3_9RHOB|nr:methylenetetrahydrofolate reductase [Pseudooceanicola sediminis]KAA2314711.1 methylenetetrahydrofolate reductase [Puniceibacterium sp. HSS470]RII39335.1 methylenetetrahydrofolate reductase [Pseudooceanicola sediminis]|tara:strand:- start:184535 stop:185443 length:909 start_codon:yes stop_codon:yes gene_type:complete